jgi:hypothetical protein
MVTLLSAYGYITQNNEVDTNLTIIGEQWREFLLAFFPLFEDFFFF